MAEVYGERPKMFTREWWSWFWMYYKWHTIIVIFVLFSVVLFAYQKSNEIKYDHNLTYRIQAMYIGEHGQNEIRKALEPKLQDANGDGEVHLFINGITISGHPAEAGLDVDLRTKHDLEFVNPYSYLYIYDTAEFDVITKTYDVAEIYLPVDEWAEELNAQAVTIGNGGIAYGVSLKDSKIMADCRMDSDDMFVFVKNDSIMKEKNEISRKNAIILANELIK